MIFLMIPFFIPIHLSLNQMALTCDPIPVTPDGGTGLVTTLSLSIEKINGHNNSLHHKITIRRKISPCHLPPTPPLPLPDPPY